jgi:hydrogenase maturation protein HypF
MSLQGRQIDIRGTVQGVGFRPWIYRLANEQHLAGRVRNDPQGVTIEAFGEPEDLTAFESRLAREAPAAAHIETLLSHPLATEPPEGFQIVESGSAGGRRVSLPPDLATCADCLAEIFDPDDRRYRYPFTNCTRCGPRFTILRDLPYDRAQTTMAPFAMCADCQREFDTVSDRRFHAQPNACPRCGPRLLAVSARHEPLPCLDAISTAACVLEADLIVALKAIGGYQLVCDATSPIAVARLRARKLREHKPFAVMVRDLEAAEELAELTPAERSLLTAVERPIVLVKRRPEAHLADEVAPGNPLVGLMLPCTPLHHLLLAETLRPLVMTSGNVAEEPIACSDDDAVQRLGGIADVFLMHDREIATRCDDSVTRVIAGRPTVLRRARGYVPRPIRVSHRFERPVLACGGHLKNAFCIGVEDLAYLGPHVGDLDNLSTLDAFEEAIGSLERLLGVKPEIVAHDLHPGYISTAYALERSDGLKVGVQHHHAHVASAMAERHLEGPVLGVAFDGTGYGSDGSIWGSEILLADFEDFTRLATFRPIPLPGGESAIRDVWRIAVALLQDAFGGKPPLDFPLLRKIDAPELESVRRLASAERLAPRSHGLGRYFDALGALVLGRPRAHYEGEVAQAWNLTADTAETGRYPFEIDRSSLVWCVDTRPMVRAVVEDMRGHVSAPLISARFHNTVAAATAAVLRDVMALSGVLPVVLTGGCFQNALLTERLLLALGPESDVHLHGEVPPGDGGLALGQAMVAAAVTRNEEVR